MEASLISAAAGNLDSRAPKSTGRDPAPRGFTCVFFIN
jgi:hypothetical protein